MNPSAVRSGGAGTLAASPETTGAAATSVLLVLTGLAAGVLLASVGGDATLTLSAISLLLAASLLVHIPVLWGGSIPVGYALLTAVPSLAAPGHGVLIVSGGLLVVAGVSVARAAGVRTAVPTVIRFAAAAAGAAAGHGTVQLVTDGGAAPLTQAVGAAVVLIVVELLVTRRVPVDGATIDVRSALPVLLTVTCGAALIAVARAAVGWEMAVIAVFPLLITRFSFRRSAAAEETLRQTVQALGLVPELAGLAPLGRSERTAVYARRVARQLGRTRAVEERIVTVCRLQHLGAVPFDPQPVGAPTPGRPSLPSASETAHQGARILEEAGFSDDVVALLRRAQAGSLDGVADDLEAAIVRVVSAFDAIVGEDLSMASHALGAITARARDVHTRLAAAALVELSATQPDLVAEAVGAGATFRDAASGLDLDDLALGTTVGDLVPFARRRQ